MSERTAAPDKLIEALKHTQIEIMNLQTSIDAAIFGARCALDVPDGWTWNGQGWAEPAPDEGANTPAEAPAY